MQNSNTIELKYNIISGNIPVNPIQENNGLYIPKYIKIVPKK